MQMRFTIKYEDAPEAVEEVVAWDSDFVAFEREFDVDITEVKDRQRYEWFAYLAWHALHRKGRAPSFDEWLNRGVEIGVQDDEDTPNEGEASGEPAAS